MLSEHFFGDLEAFDEATNNPDFFSETFVTPSSMSTASLSNNRKFIVVGRKGVGKSALQMKLAKDLENDGYLTHHFRFMYDLRSDDYAEISKTQSDISYTIASNSKQLFLHYDFRDVWERVFFRRIGETLVSKGYENKFTNLVAPKGSMFSNIFEGLSKSLTIKISAKTGPILAEFGIEPENKNSPSLHLKQFNKVTRELFLEHCDKYKLYFFVDELVFSRLDAREDEITLRAAMVRDVIRAAWELNSLCAQNKMDFHFICSLRPEIRNLINDHDSEAGKFLDGKDVDLSWYSAEGKGKGRLIVEVMKSKIEHSRTHKVDYEEFMAQEIHFGNKTMSIEEYLLTNTWGRPRDVVRLLISIAKKSPNASRIGEDEIKAGLDDYSRSSTKELIDELGVKYGSEILKALREGITRNTFDDKDQFWDAISSHLQGLDTNGLVDELFQLGFIGGYLPEKGHYFWAHRGDTYLKPHHKVRIHPALWNEFGIRSRE